MLPPTCRFPAQREDGDSERCAAGGWRRALDESAKGSARPRRRQRRQRPAARVSAMLGRRVVAGRRRRHCAEVPWCRAPAAVGATLRARSQPSSSASRKTHLHVFIFTHLPAIASLAPTSCSGCLASALATVSTPPCVLCRGTSRRRRRRRDEQPHTQILELARAPRCSAKSASNGPFGGGARFVVGQLNGLPRHHARAYGRSSSRAGRLQRQWPQRCTLHVHSSAEARPLVDRCLGAKALAAALHASGGAARAALTNLATMRWAMAARRRSYAAGWSSVAKGAEMIARTTRRSEHKRWHTLTRLRKVVTWVAEEVDARSGASQQQQQWTHEYGAAGPPPQPPQRGTASRSLTTSLEDAGRPSRQSPQQAEEVQHCTSSISAASLLDGRHPE